MNSCNIYVITNMMNGKVYVGQTWQPIKNRFAMHLSSKDCPKLYNAMNKHNRKNFKIESIYSALTQEEANAREDYFIVQFDCIKNGYNIKSGGANGLHSEETKEKLRELNSGAK